MIFNKKQHQDCLHKLDFLISQWKSIQEVANQIKVTYSILMHFVQFNNKKTKMVSTKRYMSVKERIQSFWIEEMYR